MAALRSLAVVALALALVQVSSATFCGSAPYGAGLYDAGATYGSFLGAGALPGALPDALLGAGAFYGAGYPGAGYPGAGYPGAGYPGAGYPGAGYPGVGLEEGCCPGPVIEKKTVVAKPVTLPYSYSVPTFSKKCFNNVNVDRKVIPSATVSQQCNNQVTTIKVPTTDIVTQQQPLCKKTCTTSEYVIQIPIVETTCTSAPLCKKTVKAQSNLLTTVAAKTACAKQTCVSNNVIQTPVYQTVCQDYQGAINKVGAKTVLKPEIKKSCVQLPPYKCLKPAAYPAYGDAAYAGVYPGDLALAGPGALYGGAYPVGADYAAAGAYPVGADYAAAGAYPVGGLYPGAACGAYPVPSPCGC